MSWIIFVEIKATGDYSFFAVLQNENKRELEDNFQWV